MPVDKFLKQYDDTMSKGHPIKLVPTTEQIVDQSKGELEREVEDLKQIVQAMKTQNRSSRQS